MRTAACLAASLGSLLFATTAGAAGVTWSFEGEVRDIVAAPELAPLGVVPGTPFTATITFDSSTPDTNPSPTFGDYTGAIVFARFDAAGFHASTGPSPQQSDIGIQTDVPTFVLEARADPKPGSLLDDPLIWVVGLPNVAGIFSSDALFVDPPSLDQLFPYPLPDLPLEAGTSFQVYGDQDGQPHYVLGAITRLVREPVAAPEPRLGLWLLGVALLAALLRAAAA